MSYEDPFRAPQAGYSMRPPSRGMEYGRILSFVFESPNWLMNIVWSALCVLLSGVVVGQLVMNGYQAQILIASIQFPNAQYPDFDSNKIGDYLIRGLWVWLSALLASFLLGIVALVFIGIFFAIVGLLIAATSNGGEPGVAIGLFVLFGYFFLIFGLSALTFVTVVPVMIKVGLTGNIAEMFDVQWHIDFIRRMLGSLILGALFLMLISMCLSMIGMLLCFVGIFPAAGWVMMSQGQLNAQLYRTYLERGGRPVAIQMIGPSF
jgi:hypothetical protein